MAIDRERLERIVADVLKSIGKPGASTQAAPTFRGSAGDGVFETVEEAAEAAHLAQKQLAALSLEKRGEIVSAMRRAGEESAEALARSAIAETKMGRLEHKTLKNALAATKTPGLEDLRREVKVGAEGVLLEDAGPFGVIAAITPVTNPTSTVINNAISMVCAGNSVVFCPHPQAQQCTREAMVVLNRAIAEAGGPQNLLTSVKESTLRTTVEAMRHERTALICATGGEGVVKAALESGKKAIAAGPGNPPVLVDENVADVKKAARDIAEGAYFDNNMPCTCEKEIVALEKVAPELIRELRNYDCYLISPSEEPRVTRTVVQDGKMNRAMIGQDAAVILREAGITVPPTTRIAFFEAEPGHPLVQHEQLMPIIPLIRTRNFSQAVEIACQAEHGFGHTAIIHSANMERVTEFARAVRCTILVVNAPSYAWAGKEGEGWTTLTIAGPDSGEGLTSARTFTRKHYLVVSGALNPLTGTG